MEWRYCGRAYTEKHDDRLHGFIYLIHFEDESGNIFKYYGKKKWWKDIKRNFGKKELALIADKRKRTYEYVRKDNDWREYVGSCKDTEGLIPIYKEILEFARSNRELTYMEAKVMFARGALEDEDCLNGNIMGKFFRDNLV